MNQNNTRNKTKHKGCPGGKTDDTEKPCNPVAKCPKDARKYVKHFPETTTKLMKTLL